MNYKISLRNALAVSLGFVYPGVFIALIVFFFTYSFIAFVLAFIWCVLVLGFGMYYFTTFEFFVGKSHISLQHGRLFKFVHRMSRGFITGCHTINTPFQRRNNICVLIIVCASGFYIVPGIEANCAQSITNTLILQGKE